MIGIDGSYAGIRICCLAVSFAGIITVGIDVSCVG